MKNRKQALLKSGLALLLCVSMLVSTTFAWFTDVVESGKNIIAAGNLDVELYHSNAAVTDERVKANTELFLDLQGNPILWEPGVVSYENLRVANEGSLALVYQLAINVAGENYILDNGVQYGLSQVLKVGVVKGGITATDRDGVVSSVAAADWMALSTFVREGALKADADETWGIVIYWQPGPNDNNWNANNGKQLSSGDKLSIELGIHLTATQMSHEKDSFGNDYDVTAKDDIFPSFGGGTNSVPVNVAGGYTTEAVTIAIGDITATVPAGVKVTDGTTALTLSIKTMDSSKANIVLGEDEALRSLDVHIDGVAEDNTTPITVTLPEVAPVALNMGNYNVYHVEKGATNEMTLVAADVAFSAHNQYKYDPATGDVVLYMATFSEVAVVAEDAKWKGAADHSWYDANATELFIANADQLWSFSQIVGGMAKDENGKYIVNITNDESTIHYDTFKGKTITLIADINLGDKELENNPNVIFYPIGYYNTEGTYERTNTAITSGLRNFEGTFDGNGHTIANFYHNTWEMKGDHDWYSPEEQYYRDGMGLFGRVYGGTVKNLTVKNFSSDGEIATTGVIAAYADFGATFENIAVFDCNPRVYNIGNGGIVGCVGWYTKGETDKKVTFKNITVDNSNKISALWGSYDVACGGIVGQYYPTSGQTSAGTPKNAGVHFENCHVSAIMDVYNDVCANYQYYAYRYTGMLIGSVRENETINGHSYPKMNGITASGCTVHFGTWNDYYYCEIIDNTTASYTHDYQMSRLTEIKAIDGTTITYLDDTTGTVPASGRANYVIVDYTKGHGTENATCYHFKDGAVWTHDMGGIQTGIDENGDGQDDLKEDKQHIYLEFNNLVTGYGWGVTTKVVGDLEGVTILDETLAGTSYEKFKGKVTELASGKEYKLGDIFASLNAKVAILPQSLIVSVTNVDDNNPVSAEFSRDVNNWENSTITFTGIGKVKLTIQDYYFCAPTTITVDIKDGNEMPKVDRFAIAFPNPDSLNRVGNKGTVALGKLFTAANGIGNNVSITFENVYGDSVDKRTVNATKNNWATQTVQFSGTGIIKVTISDDNFSKPVTQYLEVVDATNVTSLSGTISGNVVLLNDCGLSSLTVSGRNAVYGNGFTATYTCNGQYLRNGLKQGVVTVSENGMLDNLKIKASIYPSAFMYYGSTPLGEYVQQSSNPTDTEGIRYYYQLSAVAVSGNATISNCYIYGGRTNIFVNTGDVTIKDTILECGTVANMQIQSNASHTITLEDVTTIQYQVNPTLDNPRTSKDETQNVMLGAGIIVGPETTENPKIVLNGDFKQYNWVTADDANAVSSDTTKMIINGALGAEAYNHTVNGKTASNLGIIYMNTLDASVENKTGLPYVLGNVTLTVDSFSVNGRVYSVQNATESQIYSDYANVDKTTENGLYQPQFKYDDDLGGQYIEKDSGDAHFYREGDTIQVMFPNGDTKELDLAKLVNITKYSGQDLGLTITCKDGKNNAVTVTDGKVSLTAADTYTVTYMVTDTLFYDKDGKSFAHTAQYSWNVTIIVSLKDTKIPDARFEFDSTKQKMGYYKPSIGDVKQYLPFLAGLKIYDYNGQTEYLRFDGSNDFNKVASITITGYSSNKASVEIKLTDGGVINTQFLARANSGGGSTYTGKIKISNNTIYFVTDSGTSNKDTTTTAAYWYVDFYKFTGNNGVAIQSGQQTFNSTGSSASTPSGNFSTSIKYTVTYNANEGNCGQTVGYATSAATAVTLPTPTRSGYIFAGWYTAASGGTRVGGAGDNYTPSANITLYAQWGKPCTVTYNANGGSCGTASEKYTGTALTLPTPTRDGYWFVGWYDAATGGNKVGDAGAAYNPSGDTALYAHWQEAIEYTVTYNANGGSCGTASATYQGTALTLPTPTRTGYKFNGWYTATSGGTKIGDAGASYAPSANITLYAQWEQISYTITISKQDNATVTVDKTTAHYGDTVSVTVSFSQSNSRTLTVKDASGTSVLSKSAAGTYTFTMPNSNVTIEASSSGSCFTADTLVTLADGSMKRVDQLTFEDKILSWDFFNGTYAQKDIVILVNHGEAVYDVANLTFSDGTILRLIGDHGVFDYDLNKFVYITVDNMQDYVGHHFVQCNADGGYNTVMLVAAVKTTEVTSAYSVTSADTSNAFASGLLTVGPPEDFYNWIEMGDNMTYDMKQFQKDIETYGLYTYDVFADYLSYEQFVEWNGAYLKIAVEKGYFTLDYIYELLEMYGGWMPQN